MNIELIREKAKQSIELTCSGGCIFIARCNVLDIVHANMNRNTIRQEMEDLIDAQINYAVENNNLEYLIP